MHIHPETKNAAASSSWHIVRAVTNGRNSVPETHHQEMDGCGN
jgi:hypothetical protein